jgi:hypothetical protein
VRDGDETDVDCGGATCPPCADCSPCVQASDCANGDCSGGICVTPVTCQKNDDCGCKPLCRDGVRDGDESDVDCGGSCLPCVGTQTCRRDGDCATDQCHLGMCIPETCVDNLKDGEETDIDCGGPACFPCTGGWSGHPWYPPDLAVSVDMAPPADLTAPVDLVPPPDLLPSLNCNDGIQDGDEADVDCGGSRCPQCAVGRRCAAAGDCATRACVAGRCALAASCHDGVRNGDESDVDCGGTTCPACGNGLLCGMTADCLGGRCEHRDGGASVCGEADCADGVRDGNESDVDCGGPSAACARCTLGAACIVGADCTSCSCVAGQCAP